MINQCQLTVHKQETQVFLNKSYTMRKPDPFGTGLKTVAPKTRNGPMIYAEVKHGMTNKSFLQLIVPLVLVSQDLVRIQRL